MSATVNRLALEGITVSFGGLVAISDVSFTLTSGHILGLIGPNGAGKSTIVNVISGFQRLKQGRVRLNGADITTMKPYQRRRTGISRTFQAGRIFNNMTVGENIESVYAASGQSIAKSAAQARDVMEWVGISHLAEVSAGTLPYTDQRRVCIARALALRPAFVLMDEMAAGMTDNECEQLVAITKAIPAELGCGVLFIEHNMRVVMNVCDTIHVLDGGRTIAEDTPQAIQKSDAVRRAYLGD